MTNQIEIYLFVDPLSSCALEDIATAEEFARERKEKVCTRIIPLVNFKLIGQQMKRNKQNCTLENRNLHYTESYHASLAFQSACMQGKRLGKQFLKQLQQTIKEQQLNLSKELLLDVATQVNLDVEMFEEDMISDLSKKLFLRDQSLAKEMCVNFSPGCVVQSMQHQIGYRIDTSLNLDMLHQVFEKVADNPKLRRVDPAVQLQIV